MNSNKEDVGTADLLSTKLLFFEAELQKFFKQYGRSHLPWRRDDITPYEVWVSETMLQQTQVNRVIDYYNRFLEKYPDVHTLATSNWDEFLPYYQGLGYYRRGQNMLKCAQIVVSEHKGIFPRDKKLLMKLPGIGEYTASAILSFGYGDDYLAWDTNLQRVFGRYVGGEKKAVVDQETLSENLHMSRKDLNAALMDFGSMICVGRKPKCSSCPMMKHCQYFQTNGELEFVSEKKKSRFSSKEAQAYLFLHKDHKEYYSSNPDTYKPFILTKENNTRAKIKSYFLKKHGLTLSVRPPHKKLFIGDKPTLLINAQILQGRHEFGVFEKVDVKEFVKTAIQ